MAEFPAFPLWTDAYLGDTTHLTTIEHGAFLLLLFTAWRSPTYDLPDDDRLLARYCRLTDAQWRRIKGTIMAYWKLKDGRWYNGRLLDERDAVRRKVAQRSDAGKASALKRLHRGSTVVQRVFNENPTTKATPTVITKKERILPDKPGLSKPNGYSEDFERFWKAYPTDKNMPKKLAFKNWGKLTQEKRDDALKAIPGFRAYCEKNKGWYRPIYADRFLSQEKFEGFTNGHDGPTQAEIDMAADKADRYFKRNKYAPDHK